MTSARELELDVDDADEIAANFEAALAKDERVLWLTDAKGHRHGCVLAQVAFVEIEASEIPSGIGFSATG